MWQLVDFSLFLVMFEQFRWAIYEPIRVQLNNYQFVVMMRFMWKCGWEPFVTEREAKKWTICKLSQRVAVDNLLLTSTYAWDTYTLTIISTCMCMYILDVELLWRPCCPFKNYSGVQILPFCCHCLQTYASLSLCRENETCQECQFFKVTLVVLWYTFYGVIFGPKNWMSE